MNYCTSTAVLRHTFIYITSSEAWWYLIAYSRAPTVTSTHLYLKIHCYSSFWSCQNIMKTCSGSVVFVLLLLANSHNSHFIKFCNFMAIFSFLLFVPRNKCKKNKTIVACCMPFYVNGRVCAPIYMNFFLLNNILLLGKNLFDICL